MYLVLNNTEARINSLSIFRLGLVVGVGQTDNDQQVTTAYLVSRIIFPIRGRGEQWHSSNNRSNTYIVVVTCHKQDLKPKLGQSHFTFIPLRI